MVFGTASGVDCGSIIEFERAAKDWAEARYQRDHGKEPVILVG